MTDDEGTVVGKTFSEGVSLTDANDSIGWIGQAIEEEELWGHVCLRNDVHWENGGACGSPAFFPSYRQVSRGSVLGRVMDMDILHIRDVMGVCAITICGCP